MNRIKLIVKLCLISLMYYSCQPHSNINLTSDNTLNSNCDILTKANNLVSSLVSPNSAPLIPTRLSGPVYPANYNFDSQKAVRKALAELKTMGTAAIPVLIEHLDDERYSFTSSISVCINVNVGQACLSIIYDLIEPQSADYLNREDVNGHLLEKPGVIPRPYSLPVDSQRVKKWWRENSHLSLNAMRLIALRYRIQEEKRNGFMSKQEEEKYINPLQAELSKLEHISSCEKKP